MKLGSLSPVKGSVSKRKRIGRGHGSGLGKTSGRGHKGAGQRSGNCLLYTSPSPRDRG